MRAKGREEGFDSVFSAWKNSLVLAEFLSVAKKSFPEEDANADIVLPSLFVL